MRGGSGEKLEIGPIWICLQEKPFKIRLIPFLLPSQSNIDNLIFISIREDFENTSMM